jgi:hypothetical protein
MASFLTERERTQLEATQASSFDTSCVLLTTIEVADSSGGTTEVPSVNVVTVCRIGTPTGDERIVADRIGQVIDVVITVPWEHRDAVSARTRILVPNIVNPTAQYEIVFTNAEQSYGVAVRCACQRVV